MRWYVFFGDELLGGLSDNISLVAKTYLGHLRVRSTLLVSAAIQEFGRETVPTC